LRWCVGLLLRVEKTNLAATHPENQATFVGARHGDEECAQSVAVLRSKVECTKERYGPRCLVGLLPRRGLCYILIMRQWMRERMRRRNKRGPNDSESTGKIGQEIPVGQPTPLQPVYPDKPIGRVQEQAAESEEATKTLSEPLAETGPDAPETDSTEPPAVQFGSAPFASAKGETGEGKLVVETQPESPSLPPPEPAPASPKTPKGYVVLAIGLPGSGKTTWFKRRGVMPLSSDMLRSILFDNITEQRYQGLVFSTLRSLLRARLIAKMPWNYVDATNLSPHERRQWIKMAKSFGYDVQAVFFDVPFEICMERNRRRERIVNEEIMKKMAERLRPPSFKEGFSKITLVRVKAEAAAKPEGEA
jgi:predicted kinase